jgi:hypothetical protein
MIGLPKLQASDVYMVPFHDRGNKWIFIPKGKDAADCSLLHVDWDIGFM